MDEQVTGDHGRTPAGARVIEALRLYVHETDLYLATAGQGLHLHRTDLAALGVLFGAPRGKPVTPGRLSAELRLSPPATSAMIDRMEATGLVHRSANPLDRRSVVVEATELAHDALTATIAPLSGQMTTLLRTRDDDELSVVAAFLEEAVEHTRRARGDHASQSPTPCAPLPRSTGTTGGRDC